MDLPLLLAGPILRRVETNLASVWLALSEPATVEMPIWEVREEVERRDPLFISQPTNTLRVGDRLHIALVALEIPVTAGQSLQPDTLYSYDLRIRTKANPELEHDLKSLGLLDDGPGRVPLGFEDGLLPSFAPPPSQLAHLNILYGSCRRPGHKDPDALAWVDDLIFDKDRYKDARARPHQLWLGGDQIYADDVESLHMLLVMKHALPLIGEPVEHVPVDEVMVLRSAANDADPTENPLVDPANPAASYMNVPPGAPVDLPVDRLHFPEGFRLNVTLRDAQFTSGDGSSHIISLGEFAALYLTVWSDVLWEDEVPGLRFIPEGDTGNGGPVRWNDEVPANGVLKLPTVHYPQQIAAHFYVPPTQKEVEERNRKSAAEIAKEEAAATKKVQASLRRSLKTLNDFRKGLPKVRRALANVPTYMILDDHDVTDDYFLNPAWRNRVLTRALGQAILSNAMVAYALFQDWGNDPRKYLDPTGAHAELLSLVPRLFPQPIPTPSDPDKDVRGRIAKLLGHNLPSVPIMPDGPFPSVKPPLTWHFKVDGPRHRVVALDNRTRRSYVSINGPPGNVSIEALKDQLPKPPLPADCEILIVVAPLQVIGPPVLDDIVAPISYRAFDLIEGREKGSELAPTSTSGLRQMLGTNPDAIEAWAFDTVTFEHLLKRLAEYGRVVLLSGDVHYSAGTVMSYWRGDSARPARFAQFTSSGLKNVMPEYIRFLDRSLGVAQQLIRADIGAERLGWEAPAEEQREEIVRLPEGKTKFDLVPVTRSRLKATPLVLPTWGWPAGSSLNPDLPPDWRWRIKPLIDDREDVEDVEDGRPSGIRTQKIDEEALDADLSSPETLIDAYQTVAMRHQFALDHMRNGRQILFRANVGQVRFVPGANGKLDAKHLVYTTDPSDADSEPEPYLVQIAPLGPVDEERPGELRRMAIP